MTGNVPGAAVALHHVGLLVDDVDGALAFYTDVLGLSVRDDRPEFPLRGAWLDVGAGQHVALRVDDLEAVVERLERLGVAFKSYPRGEPPRQVIVHDPAGNRIELTRG